MAYPSTQPALIGTDIQAVSLLQEMDNKDLPGLDEAAMYETTTTVRAVGERKLFIRSEGILVTCAEYAWSTLIPWHNVHSVRLKAENGSPPVPAT